MFKIEYFVCSNLFVWVEVGRMEKNDHLPKIWQYLVLKVFGRLFCKVSSETVPDIPIV